ncbi:MAG: dienelactone hydrolase family protein [Candidatus Hydrogenedentes bacterium]|nr:dienelactone hydrolase family protein [Candidatus Hydrogenedentota bacterium]
MPIVWIARMALACCVLAATASAQGPLPGTEALDASTDFAVEMVAGINTWLTRETETARNARGNHWAFDVTDVAAHAAKRAHLRTIIGANDPRLPATVEAPAPFNGTALIAQSETLKVYAMRWPVFRNVYGEGLLLEPVAPARGTIIVLPDCDEVPEAWAGVNSPLAPEQQTARILAEQGYRVVVPVLLNRADTWSGDPAVRYTNQPHREFVYRPAYELGHHIIGLEVQKIEALVEWSAAQGIGPVGLYGYGEGGLIAFYTAALNENVAATVVSGYFGPREGLWQEPIYRNVWDLLRVFGDAEIARLVLPRTLIVEAVETPRIDGPPQTEGRSGAAPGRIAPLDLPAVQAEFVRAQSIAGAHLAALQFFAPAARGAQESLTALLTAMGNTVPTAPATVLQVTGTLEDPNARMQRQVQQAVDYTQALLEGAATRRADYWKEADMTSLETFAPAQAVYRQRFHEEAIGALPPATEAVLAFTAPAFETETVVGYHVKLPVYDTVFAYGLLLVPKNIAPEERRPVIVCQHGLEGRPAEVSDPTIDSHYYHSFGYRLAELGYITFAPQNPYIGKDDFRVLQRKANPLKLSLFSFIVRQHERILEWLKTQPNVDPARMAFYGLSYGGKTAMRVPAILPGYCLSICSGDFNEWIWKNCSTKSAYSYVFTGEYEMFEFNLGNTFNYAEMSWLMAPRPFMVERGHDDGVAPDTQVAYEYARTRYTYTKLGHADKTELEFFNGPHTINGVGTFAFLQKQLGYPALP